MAEFREGRPAQHEARASRLEVGVCISAREGESCAVAQPVQMSAISTSRKIADVPDECEAEAFIEELKAAFEADSDSALADVMGVHRSTISFWRKRGRVPRRYRSLRDYTGPVSNKTKHHLPSEAADAIQNPLMLDDHIRAALKGALYRFLDESQDVLDAPAAILQAVSRGARAVPLSLYSIWSEMRHAAVRSAGRQIRRRYS